MRYAACLPAGTRLAGRARAAGSPDSRGRGRRHGCPPADPARSRPARREVGWSARLGEREHRRDARIGPLEHAAHSSRLRVANAAANASRCAGHVARSYCSPARLDPEHARRARPRTAAPARRRRRTGRRRTRTRRRTARHRRGGSRPRSSRQPPAPSIAWTIVSRCAAPSTIAASTTCPRPVVPRGTRGPRAPRRRGTSTRPRSRRATGTGATGRSRGPRACSVPETAA